MTVRISSSSESGKLLYRFEVIDVKGLLHAVSAKTFTSPVRASQAAATFANKGLRLKMTPESVPFKKGHAPKPAA